MVGYSKFMQAIKVEPKEKVKIKSVVIPAAGKGSRLGEITNFIPKEALPLGGIPAIKHCVKEALESGVEKIIIISSQKKLPLLKEMLNQNEVTFLVQERATGLGGAVLQAKRMIAEDYFGVLLPDDLLLSKNAFKELQEKYKSDPSAGYILGFPVNEILAENYGIASTDSLGNISSVMEKPQFLPKGEYIALMGRYILPYTIFEVLENITLGKNAELQLTDAIEKILASNQIKVVKEATPRLDIGTYKGWLEANILIGREHYGETWLADLLS